MREGASFKILSLAAGVVLVGCSDPSEPNSGIGGTGAARGGSSAVGGSAGTGMGGVPGNGGSSGAGGSIAAGGSPGVGGTNAAGGTGSEPDSGAPPPCTGCLELRVPVTTNNQNTLFQFSVGNPSPKDMSNAVVTFSIRALTLGDQLTASPFAQDGTQFDFESQFTPLNATNGFVDDDSFHDLVFSLAALPPPATLPVADAGADAGPGAVDPGVFDKGQIIQFGLGVGSAGAFVSPGADAGGFVVTVLLDSITITGVDANVLPSVTFDDGPDGFAINAGAQQPGSVIIHHPAP